MNKKIYFTNKDGDESSAKLYTTLTETGNYGIETLVDNSLCYIQYGLIDEMGATGGKVDVGGVTYSILSQAKGAQRPIGFLQISTDIPRQGADLDNLRDVYIPCSLFHYAGEWFFDSGASYMEEKMREKRAYCIKGSLDFKFTGRTLIIRIMLDSGMGKASVLIDGMKPSLIPGVSVAVDVLDCDLENYSFAEDAAAQYYDIVVAENLPYKEHVCSINANNANTYFILSAAKARDLYLNPVVIQGYHEGYEINKFLLRFINSGSDEVRNLSLSFPDYLKGHEGESLNGECTLSSIPYHTDYALKLSVDGSRISDDLLDLSIKMSADYKYAGGDITFGEELIDIDVRNAAMIFASGWFKDTEAPGKIWRAYSNGVDKTVKFSCPCSSFSIVIQKDYGWGRATVKIEGSDVIYATLNCHDENGGGVLQEVVVSGLPAGDKIVVIASLDKAAKPFVFTSVSYRVEEKYKRLTETLPVSLRLDYVKPFGVTGLVYDNSEYKWDVIDKERVDYSIPRSNRDVSIVQVVRRFPTYAVNYSEQQHDLLKYYDLLIVDPGTVTRREVKEWQAMGIIVLGYVSFGEEDGVVIDPWAENQSFSPHVDDGAGVGGYASYYNKGGNSFGEINQCVNDCLINTHEKRCLLDDEHYFTGIGCCSRACKNDSRDSYSRWELGESCGGGYTAKNYWDRTADSACVNENCPKYSPYHGGCKQYEACDCYGQDLSYTTPEFPDQNGIWGASFINPIAPRWKEKLRTVYLQRVFGEPQKKTEIVTLKKYVSASGTTFVFRASDYPIDKGEPISVATKDGNHIYARSEYDLDSTAGAFQMEMDVGADDGFPIQEGMELTITYYSAGIGADGVFMDTVDTVDVYPSNEFQQAMIDMINGLKQEFSTKYFLSNRGFSILPGIIQSCSYVMFETFITEYDWNTGKYYRITNENAISFNNSVKEMLKELRKKYQFDVLALNYCDDGSAGDEFRELIMQECYAEGYLSWSSNILLDNVLHPNRFSVKSDAWKNHISDGNPFFKDMTAVDMGTAFRYPNGIEVPSEETENKRIWVKSNSVERDQWHKVKEYRIE